MRCNYSRRHPTCVKFCMLYVWKNRLRSVDKLRLELFLTDCKSSNGSSVNKVKKLDFATLPTSSRVLLKKLKRSSCIARLRRNCLNANPQAQDVLSFGWGMKDDHLYIQWFDGNVAPKSRTLCVNVN